MPTAAPVCNAERAKSAGAGGVKVQRTDGRYVTLLAPATDVDYGRQDTPAGAPVGAPIRTDGDASF
jgi:hypothetical protein